MKHTPSIHEREKAQKFFKTLSPQERWELGDQLVLGDLDILYWFDGKRQTRAFMNELDYQRMLWEQIEC